MLRSRMEDQIMSQRYGPLVVAFQWDDNFAFSPTLDTFF